MLLPACSRDCHSTPEIKASHHLHPQRGQERNSRSIPTRQVLQPHRVSCSEGQVEGHAAPQAALALHSPCSRALRWSTSLSVNTCSPAGVQPRTRSPGRKALIEIRAQMIHITSGTQPMTLLFTSATAGHRAGHMTRANHDGTAGVYPMSCSFMDAPAGKHCRSTSSTLRATARQKQGCPLMQACLCDPLLHH